MIITVKDLIRELKHIKKDAEIFVFYPDGDGLSGDITCSRITKLSVDIDNTLCIEALEQLEEE